LGDPAAALMSLITRYKASIERGELKPDAAQEAAVRQLRKLSDALVRYRPGRHLLFPAKPPQGLYLWGDVGRGKSMLMDMFFDSVAVGSKRRVHFNAFMVDVHARIHAERQRGEGGDPIAPVARTLAAEASLLCFDEFQVTDVADAMILGRLFEQLFARGVVVVTTSNVEPDRLYEDGLNRQLFIPFIALLVSRLDVVALDGPIDYRLHRMGTLKVYLTPISSGTAAEMDAAWLKLTDAKSGSPMVLTVLGRTLRVPQAAKGVARFSFGDLCVRPLAAADYLAIAQTFHTVMIDGLPAMTPTQRNEARRFVVLIDTLYDEGVKLVCSAETAPDALYPEGDGTDAFRRTVSRLIEMQTDDYLRRGHGVHTISTIAAD
jgi:cell division protein ZapE